MLALELSKNGAGLKTALHHENSSTTKNRSFAVVICVAGVVNVSAGINK